MTTSWQWYRGRTTEPLFRTDHPTRDSLVATIVATGTIEPEEVIDVGAQVAGQILSFGRDPANAKRTIDYGSPVEQGTVLARIDDSLYAPEVAIARADLGVCAADVRHAESELIQMRSQLHKAERDLQRGKRLELEHSISQTEIDALQSAWETANASVPAAEADLEKAKQSVEKSRGTLLKAEKNLGYCTIKSPVKGIIIDRRVNVGQTVVSSLNAPSLFLIAKDLRRLQIWVSVNEADIGNIYPGTGCHVHGRFLPGRRFSRHRRADPAQRHDDSERRHLHRCRQRRKRRRQARSFRVRCRTAGNSQLTRCRRR